MTYEEETTGAISRAIRELSHIANTADNIADYEKLSIIAMNAAAELDKLTNNICRTTRHIFIDGVCVQCGTPTTDKLKEVSEIYTSVCPTCGGNEVLFEGSERQQPCPDCQGHS